MGWTRRPNAPDPDPNATGENNPLADNMRLNRPRRNVPGETPPTESGSIFDQQTVVDSNFSGRSEARRQRQGSPFSTQQLSTWAADPGNSRKLLTIGGVALGLLLLLVLFYVYNRTGSTVATDTTAPFGSAAPLGSEAGPIIGSDPLASATPELGTAPQPVQPVPNTDPAQQAPQPAAGAVFAVTGTATEGLFLRQDHSTQAQILGTLPEGTRVQSLGEEFTDDVRTWRRVSTEQFGEGWVAAEYLQPAP